LQHQAQALLRRRHLDRDTVRVHPFRKAHAQRLDAFADQAFGQPVGGPISSVVAVVGDQDALDAMPPERGHVVVGETLDAVGGGDVRETCTPEGHGVEQRFAQDDLALAICQAGFVPHAPVRTGQVQVQRRALT
jgi:hypothetical protein